MSEQTWETLKAWLLRQEAVDENVGSAETIRRLDLSGREIEQLPENFGLLNELVALNLANNALSALPDSMKALTKLGNLDLRRNDFETLPDVLVSMNIRSLNASGNRLSDVSVLAQCRALRVLDLAGNVLTSIDDALCPENELRTVNVSCNYITDLENVFPLLGTAERLNASGNVLKRIPRSIAAMKSLLELDLSDNQIASIDDAFFTLPLESVDLTSNRLEKVALRGLEDLESMTLDANPLGEVGFEDDFAPYLKLFSCDGCGLQTFPVVPSMVLENLCYSSNDIAEIPEAIGCYTQLTQLDIDNNKIVHLPHAMANMTRLQTLYIGGNPLDEEALKVIQVLHPDICDLNMKTGIVIEKATEADLPQMAELIGILFAIEQDFDIDYEKQLAGITKLFRHGSADLLVARHDAKVVGMVTMQRLISSAAGDFIGQIEDLIVLDAYRKSGVGSRLINKMRFMAQTYGYKRIQLAADIDNDYALQFYTRRGFRRTNLTVFHFKNQ